MVSGGAEREEVAERYVQMALDENHFGPVTQMDGPMEIRFVDEHQRQGHEGEGREEAGAQQDYPLGPHFARMLAGMRRTGER